MESFLLSPVSQL